MDERSFHRPTYLRAVKALEIALLMVIASKADRAEILSNFAKVFDMLGIPKVTR